MYFNSKNELYCLKEPREKDNRSDVCCSLNATLTLSSDSRALKEYLDPEKISQPSHRAIISEHPVLE